MNIIMSSILLRENVNETLGFVLSKCFEKKDINHWDLLQQIMHLQYGLTEKLVF